MRSAQVFAKARLLCAALFAFIVAGCAATIPIDDSAIAGGKIATKIAASADKSLALDREGKVWAVGSNKYGQLGLGDEHRQSTFAKVKSLADKKIVEIAAGYGVSFAIDETGAAFASGLNNFGQLGLGDAKNRDKFERITSLASRKVVAIAAGADHAIALDSEGRVYAAGLNNFGQLGLGDAKDRDRFELVTSLADRKIVAIAAGYDHSFAIDETGAAFASGWNARGQLGLGDAKDRSEFVAIGSLSAKKIVAIAAGDHHSVALDSEGRVYTAGFGIHGQLGLDEELRSAVFVEALGLNGAKIAAIAAGGFHTFALDSDGKMWATGFNGGGALGLGDRSDRRVFVKSDALSGYGLYEQITAVAAGADHTIAIYSGGYVFVCGWNYEGQLGLGENRLNDFALEFEQIGLLR
ncbi:MAG: hypothetical protein LBO72_00650 [Helicobacteraceae bacterium]|jgi:alpha-tubulin suppressor-like RCC1 family protein|nr:hypothetical protein [Helicobacteraceae bacterium]